jgi:hypothetical protein
LGFGECVPLRRAKVFVVPGVFVSFEYTKWKFAQGVVD